MRGSVKTGGARAGLRLAGGVLAALCLARAQAFAQSSGQSASPTPGPGTVVTGVTVPGRKPFEPPKGAPVKPTAQQRAFVRSHAAASRIGQMTRWADPVCPTTLGLPPEMNDFVTERIKAVAAEVGAPAGPCKSDVVVVFADHPQVLLDAIRKKAPVLLGYHHPAQTRRLATVSHPIQAWYATATAGAADSGVMGGLGVGNSSGALGAGGQSTGTNPQLDDADGGEVAGCLGTHFSQCRTSQIVAVVVVADRAKVADHTIGSIADYVAMLVLSKVELSDKCEDLDSITNLMASQCDAGAAKPEALTEADLAYLKALYAIDMSRLMWVQRDSLADIMAKVMAGH